MKHIVVDFEMNHIRHNKEAAKLCGMEIIEIGAVMLDENYQEISSFRTYVRPEYNDRISPSVEKLTGISYGMVASAPTFKSAFRSFTTWCLGNGSDVSVHAWSDSDYNQISKEIAFKDYACSLAEQELLSNWNDFQKRFDDRMGIERALSLSQALDYAGITFQGRKHDALDDARNTAELYSTFMKPEEFDRTLKKIEEALKPTPEIGSCLGDLFDFSALGVA